MIRVNPARSGRISVIAALGVLGVLLIGSYRAANTDTVIEFLRDLDRSSAAKKLVFWDSTRIIRRPDSTRSSRASTAA